MFKSDLDARAELFCYATINLRSDEMTANWLAKLTVPLPICLFDLRDIMKHTESPTAPSKPIQRTGEV